MRLTRRHGLAALAALPLAGTRAASGAPAVRPQDFGAVPDGAGDAGSAIQRAIDAAGAGGGRVVLEDGIFRLDTPLRVTWPGLALAGDATLVAGPALRHTTRAALIDVQAPGVRIEGLTLDQRNLMPTGYSVRAEGAAGLRIAGVVSRDTQGAFVLLGDDCRDVEITGCDHQGRGYGVLAPDSRGLERILIRECAFVHPGSGSVGDGVELNCPTHGARRVSLVDVSARGYVGEARNAGIGFGFARVRETLLVNVAAEDCEGDGFHWENGSDDAVVLDCRAHRIGRADPAGGNGSGFIAYDCARWLGRGLEAMACAYHGIALSGQGRARQVAGARILDCTVLGTGRDGIHLTAQRDFEVSRCRVRDPSAAAAGRYAGIHVGRQGGTRLENVHGRGTGNVIELSGATRPLGTLVVREASVDVAIDATVRHV